MSKPESNFLRSRCISTTAAMSSGISGALPGPSIRGLDLKPTLVLTEKLGEAELEVFGSLASVDRLYGLMALELYDAIIGPSGTNVFESSGEHVKVVGRAGVGIDNVDLPSATGYGIALRVAMPRNVPYASASVEEEPFETPQEGLRRLFGLHFGAEELAETWVIVSGASFHMTHHRHWFEKYEDFDGEVSVGNSSSRKIVGLGSVKVRTKDGREQDFVNVRHVPELAYNLLSVSQLGDNGCKTYFDRDCCQVKRNGNVMIRGIRNGSIYSLDAEPISFAKEVRLEERNTTQHGVYDAAHEAVRDSAKHQHKDNQPSSIEASCNSEGNPEPRSKRQRRPPEGY